MRALGVDPSSSVTGLAYVEDGIAPAPSHLQKFTRDPNVGVERGLQDFYNLLVKSYVVRPDIVVVEVVSVTWNMNTVRKIAYFESIAMFYAARCNARLFMVQATKARRIVLSKGTLSKENAVKEVKARWPEFADKSDDECDALVLAMAAETLVKEAGNG